MAAVSFFQHIDQLLLSQLPVVVDVSLVKAEEEDVFQRLCHRALPPAVHPVRLLWDVMEQHLFPFLPIEITIVVQVVVGEFSPPSIHHVLHHLVFRELCRVVVRLHALKKLVLGHFTIVVCVEVTEVLPLLSSSQRRVVEVVMIPQHIVDQTGVAVVLRAILTVEMLEVVEVSHASVIIVVVFHRIVVLVVILVLTSVKPPHGLPMGLLCARAWILCLFRS
mmetsp:Transcript_43525/g.137703  ORF Transcript_43525/g.137703 Transcript_43525/m.137703 type:complete len:221 (-) Transcript_43525:275-937(-)